jgi:cyclophilin family peptidyl-prolyl cis-trans isomerase
MLVNWTGYLSKWKSVWGRKNKRRASRRTSFRYSPRFENLETRLAPAGFFGGVSIASGDIEGNHIPDIVIGAGPGGGPHVKVFSGRDGSLIRSFMAYDPGFTGGVNVAVADVDGDGTPDIITGPGPGGGPNVRVFSGRDGSLIRSFMAYDPGFTGGVNVAAADLDNDGFADIITGPGQGAPNVRVFSGRDGHMMNNFFAYSSFATGGVHVAAGDVDGTGSPQIITAAGPGGGPHVKVYNPNTLATLNSFFAYDAGFHGGVNVAVGPVDQNGTLGIITGAGSGGGPHVKAFNIRNNITTESFFAYDPAFTGGVNVGTAGSNNLVTGTETQGDVVQLFTGGNVQPSVSFSGYNPAVPPPHFQVVTDVTPPTLQITSGPSQGLLTRTNVTIQGRAQDDDLSAVEQQVDGSAFNGVSFDASGNFTFATTFPVDGTADGSHTVVVRARDRAGNISTPSSFTFTLKTTALTPTFDLDPSTDSGLLGDQLTSFSSIKLTGRADANAAIAVTTPTTTLNATADGSGNWSISNITIAPGPNAFTARATDSLGNQSNFMQTITLVHTPTVSTPIANVNVAAGAPAQTIDLFNNFASPEVGGYGFVDQTHPVGTQVRIVTNRGNIDMDLFDQRSPITVANFVHYLVTGRFNDSIFHRNAKSQDGTPFVLQGGGFNFRSNPSRLDATMTDPAIQNEFAISNTRGTVAMAKLGSDPNSATSQFFFNLGDNHANLDNQNGGFTVFAKVQDASLPVMDSLAAIRTQDQSRANSAFNEIPLLNYTGNNFPTDTTRSNFAIINGMTFLHRSDVLSFRVQANDNQNLVTTNVIGNKLTLNFVAGQHGTANITIRASNLEGLFVDTTFRVTVT